MIAATTKTAGLPAVLSQFVREGGFDGLAEAVVAHHRNNNKGVLGRHAAAAHAKEVMRRVLEDNKQGRLIAALACEPPPQNIREPLTETHQEVLSVKAKLECIIACTAREAATLAQRQQAIKHKSKKIETKTEDGKPERNWAGPVTVKGNTTRQGGQFAFAVR